MNVFEFAKQKELYSERFYRHLAGRAPKGGLSYILTLLADEEADHYQVVDRMSRGIPPQVTETGILDGARQIFERMKGSADQVDLDVGALKLYQRARELEEESRRFYLSRAREVGPGVQKRVFRQLADQEYRHFIVLENLCAFAARPRVYGVETFFWRADDSVTQIEQAYAIEEEGAWEMSHAVKDAVDRRISSCRDIRPHWVQAGRAG